MTSRTSAVFLNMNSPGLAVRTMPTESEIIFEPFDITYQAVTEDMRTTAAHLRTH